MSRLKRRQGKPGPPGISEERIANALRRGGGIIAEAARILKCTHGCISMRVSKSEVLQQARAEGSVQLIDEGQSEVVQAIHQHDMTTVRWYLDRKARHLGYGAPEKEQFIPAPPPPAEDQAEEDKRRQALDMLVAALDNKARESAARIPPQPMGALGKVVVGSSSDSKEPRR